MLHLSRAFLSLQISQSTSRAFHNFFSNTVRVNVIVGLAQSIVTGKGFSKRDCLDQVGLYEIILIVLTDV